MSDNSQLDFFLRAAKTLSIPLSPRTVPPFQIYFRELRAWNEKINLTSIIEEKEVYINHFIDSLIPERLIPQNSNVIDIGSGGGFPGIPLKIIRPDIQVTLADASQKKVFFLRHTIRTLGLKGIEAIHERVENLPSLSCSYQVCISRAFASLPKYLSTAMALRAPKGIIIAMKGPNVQTELNAIESHISLLGISIIHFESYILPFTNKRRTIIVFGQGKRFT